MVGQIIEPSGLYYPNRFARYWLLAMEEVMGRTGLNTLLHMAGLDVYVESPPPDTLAKQFDFAFVAAMSEALEEIYGPRGGRGIALRVGRSMFGLGLKDFGAFAGMSSPAFLALPLEQRTHLGVETLSQVFSRFSDQRCRVLSLDDHYQLIVETSPMAWGRVSDRPVCHALTGVFQEGLRWASDGCVFYVQEMSCRAHTGEPCVFKINKNPIGGANCGQ